MKKASILFLLAAWLWSLPMAAQFRHYSTDEGMPSNCVRDLVQDDKGFIWIASDGGISRFDGRNFKTYKLGGEDIEDDNYVMSLLMSNGELWIGTDAHLFRYDNEYDRFEYVRMPDDSAPNRRGVIWDMEVDKDGNIWMVVEDKGVVRMKKGKDGYEFDTFKLPGMLTLVGGLLSDSRNDIWCVSTQNGGGIFKYDKAANEFKSFDTYLDGKKAVPSTYCISEDNAHDIYLGAWDGRVLILDPYSGVLTPLSLSEKLWHIHALTPTQSGQLFIGSDAGLGVYDKASQSLAVYRPEEINVESISDQFVYPIIQDKEGGVWIGTFYGGVNYMMPGLKIFGKSQASRFENSVSGNVISKFVEDSNGNIFVASDDGGLTELNAATGRFRKINLPSSNLHALMIDGDDLWIGSYSGGVYAYNLGTGNLRSFTADSSNPNSIADNSCYAMLRDSKGQLWIAARHIASVYDKVADRFIRMKNLGATIVDIDEDSNGDLWFSTQGQGIYVYAPATDSWRHYVHSSGPGKLSHNHVYAIDIDPKGNIWVANASGLSRYDAATDAFEDIALPFDNVAVTSLVEDQGCLWLTTQHGLIKYVPEGKSEVYTKNDGLCSSQFSANSMLKTSNGKIYVGTRNGFNSFFPYQIKSNQNVPYVAFTSVQLGDVPIEAGDERLEKSIDEAATVTLNHDDNNFAINFAALSFVNPEKNQYKYRLAGFDSNWVNSGDRCKALYSNLPAGTYKFEVMGSNGDNVWNETPRVLKVRVLPPWYLSWPMKVLYGILAIGLISFLISYLLRRNENKHRQELRRINSDKEIEVYQAKLSFFTMVAHEIRTPVSLIIAPLEKLLHTPNAVSGQAASDLNIVERNSQRLLYLVNQLLDFKKVEEAGMSAEFSTCRIVDLLRNVTDRFRPTLEQKDVELTEDYGALEDFEADVDAEAVTKAVSNLLNNARKFTKDKIAVRLTRDEHNGTFSISVSDNGVGLSKANKQKIFRPFYQVTDNGQAQGGTGIGLTIVRGVAESHQGKTEVESELGHGSTFTITLPVKQAVVKSKVESVENEEKAVVADTPNVVKKDVKRKMLIVDDNTELCNFIAGSFSGDYEVITAENGVDALEVLKRSDIDMIVSDWMMPKMDGVELCKAVRDNKAWSHIPFVLLTAKTDNMSKVEGLNCGADAFVEKPFSMQVLEARIDNLLHMREMLREKYSTTPLEPIDTIAPHQADNEFLSQLTAIIEENFSNSDLDVDFLASKMDMSRSSMYSKIRSLADVTPNDLIRITRLKHAAKLLLDSRYRINEVCYMVGFNSSSYFAKCFQKQFGMTPSEFISSKS